MSKSILFLINLILIGTALGLFLAWWVGVAFILITVNATRFIIIKRIESYRNNIPFNTPQGKAIIKDYNKTLNILRWSFPSKR